MAPLGDPSHGGVWLLVTLGALAFLSPLRLVWASEGAPWYSAFVVWVVLIGATALVVRRRSRDQGGGG